MQSGKIKHYWQKALHAINGITLPGTRRLERELSAVVADNQSLTAELKNLLHEFEALRNRERGEIATLGKKVEYIEAERDDARGEIRKLQSRLEEASNQQEATLVQVSLLENRLQEEHAGHEATLEALHASLGQLQSRQQTLLQFQSGLDESVRKTKRHLLEAIQAESSKSSRQVFGLVAITVLFLLGTLAGASTIWMVRQDLRELSAVSRDLRVSIEAHLRRHELALSAPPQTVHEPALPEPRAEVVEVPGDYPLYHVIPQQDVATRHEVENDHADPALEEGEFLYDEEPYEDEHDTSEPGPEPASDARGADSDMPLALTLLSQQERVGAGPAGASDTEVRHAADLAADLAVLGFGPAPIDAEREGGPGTGAALREFRLLYGPVLESQETSGPQELALAVRRFADLAREDRKRYGIGTEVLAAIRLSNLRTGVDFSFLMGLAGAESTFNAESRAAQSSAAGLYQFKQDTWLDTIKRHGRKYGLEAYVSRVEYYIDELGNRRPMIGDPVVYRQLLDLRHDPRLSALMAAEYLKDNLRRLSSALEQEPGHTEMYLTHFFGLSGAITFLERLGSNPDQPASELFPGPASRNRTIFHARDRTPRTVAEVYDVLARKLETSRYEDWRAN